MTEKDIDFENKLWKAADKLRKKVEVHEYKYVVLGLIFLRYISFAFEEKRKELKNELDEIPHEFKDRVMEDRDVYIADGTMYVPEKARWDYIKKNAHQPNIGEILDDAIESLEREHPKQLKDVIPKIYTKINLSPDDLALDLRLLTYYQLKFSEDEIMSHRTGSAIPHLDKDYLLEFTLLLPPQPILKKFRELVEPLFRKIINNQKEIIVLRKIRDALLPQLVFGKLSGG